jgi:hypothetical protein
MVTKKAPTRLLESNKMRKLVPIVFLLGLASSTQAMPVATIQQLDDMVTPVREACGPGMQRVNGVCRRNTTVRAACAAGLRLVNGRCVR